MTQDRLGLRVIDGVRPLSGRRSAAASEPLSVESSSPSPDRQTGREKTADLALALHSNEQRLSRLLQDRDRLGRDLHDGALQSLYAIGLSLDGSRRCWRTAPKKAADRTCQAIAQVNRLIQEIRGLILQLESDSLKGFDLEAELRTMVDIYQGAGHMAIDLAVDPAVLARLTLEESQQIAFVVREALSNSLRHGKARRTAVSLRSTGGTVRVEIVDQGRGFRQTKTAYRGYGLTNMTARAQYLGGHLAVTSRLGHGTRVLLTLPLLATSETQ